MGHKSLSRQIMILLLNLYVDTYRFLQRIFPNDDLLHVTTTGILASSTIVNALWIIAWLHYMNGQIPSFPKLTIVLVFVVIAMLIWYVCLREDRYKEALKTRSIEGLTIGKLYLSFSILNLLVGILSILIFL